MPTPIPCPGERVLNSVQTKSGWGFCRASAEQDAQQTASDAVLEDLKKQVNDAQCENNCYKKADQIRNLSVKTNRCWRSKWTLWIIARCEATASGNVTVYCTKEEPKLEIK